MEKIFEAKAEGDFLPCAMKEFLYRSGLSVTLVKKAKLGSILLNSLPVTVRATVKKGDLVEIYIPTAKSEAIESIDIPLRILYEDEWLIAVDKPVNMPTHPSKGNNLPTLANAIMAYYGGNFVFRAVNRLDRDTSGIVIIAKTQMSACLLSASMKKGLWKKKYHALAEGIFQNTDGIIDAPIERESEGSIKRVVRPDGKPAKTVYSVITEENENSLCEVTLLTGRTHQIRVHFSYIGHPLVSDYLYGMSSDKEYYLRCKEITFPHPKTNEILVIKA